MKNWIDETKFCSGLVKYGKKEIMRNLEKQGADIYLFRKHVVITFQICEGSEGMKWLI